MKHLLLFRKRILSSPYRVVVRFMLLFFLLTMVPKLSAGVWAQNVRINLSLQNVPIEEVLNKIENLSKYRFLYNKGQVDVTTIVSVEARQETVEEILQKLFETKNIAFTISGHQIVLNIASSRQTSPQSARKVHGVVLDVRNNPIIGANIIEKGTSNGVISDLEGRFALDVPPGAVVSISYIGYLSQEVRIPSTGDLKIVLKENSKTLDEVVVVGYGIQRKVNLTGAVGIAQAKELESRPVTSATQALQGLVPGLQISTNTGEIGKSMNIQIRGTGTIGEGSSGSPLILIDGMEGDLNSVNPQDIDNVSVLKDAAAASIYGSRAPFGVILVTTKRGKQGKPSVNYNNSFRVSSPINMPKMMDSYTFANYYNAASHNNGDGDVFGEDIVQKMLDYQAGTDKAGLFASSNGQWGKPDFDPFTTAYANTDWYKEIYKGSVFSQEHNVSINGGSEKITYYASFNYLNQNGLLRHGKDGLKRYNGTAKINTTLTNWLKFNYSMRFSRTDNYRPTNFNGNTYNNIGRQTWPNLPVYDPNGYYFNSNAATPPMQLALGGERNVQTDRLYHQVALLLEPYKNWITHVEFNYSILNADVNEVSLPTYNHDVNGDVVNTNGTSSIYVDHRKEDYLNLNIYSEYSRTFNDIHHLKVMAGFQAEEMKQAFSSLKKYGLLIDELPEVDLSTGTDGTGKDKPTEASGYHNEWATAGFFGRVNYDYDGRYLAEMNLRYDGTSRFRRGSRWRLYPSFSIGWNIAREAFWQPLTEAVNTLKVRASYGELGNQNTNEWYPTYRQININSNNGAWLQGGVKPNTASVGDLVSNTLTWETIRTWNIGLDFGLFNNRLTGSFDYYTRYTDNMVGPSPELPLTLGIATPKMNNCDLQTRGWELSIGWNDHLENGLGYGIKFMLSDAKTIIDSYPSNKTHSIDTYMKGREIGEIWGFETIGIARTDQEMQDHLNKVGGQDALGSKWAAGDIMYADLDGKSGITAGARTLEDHGDLKVIGNKTPHYLFGIDLSADWKGVDFRCFFQGVMKRDYWQGSNMFWGVTDDLWWSAGLAEHNDYFRAEPIGLEGHQIAANLNSYYPRPIFGSGSKNQQVQTRYLQRASYIRLKNLQLGYTLPSSLIQKLGINKCRIFVSGENLWTGTKLSRLFDPETIDGGNTDVNANKAVRNGGNAYPLSSTWSFGLSLTL